MHVLIPVKSLKNAKSRLSKDFSQIERQKIVLKMLHHVIEVLTSCKEITHISLVTPDTNIIQEMGKFNIYLVLEEKPGYNESLFYAAQKEDSNQKLLTLPADLPLITEEDIH